MSDPRLNRRYVRALAALAALLSLVVVAERARWFARLRGAPAPERLWIWTADPPQAVQPRVFFVARDFPLAAVPLSARVEVLGDPEYQLWINGHLVGSDRYRIDAPIDVYEIGPLLVAGSNRVVLELRSPIGSGGATLRMTSGDGRQLVESDGNWSIYRSSWFGLFRAEPLFPTAKAAVVGRSPTARWGSPRVGPVRPRFEEILAADNVVAAAAFRRPTEATEWMRIARRPPRHGRMGGFVEIDFGRTVTGYLHLQFDARQIRGGLVRYGKGDHELAAWEPDAIVLEPPNRDFWQDSYPHRFRFVQVVGIPELRWAGVSEIHEAGYAALAPPPPAPELFGANPPPPRLPLVDEIWREYFELKRYPPPAEGTATIRRGDAARKPGRARGPGGHRHRQEAKPTLPDR